ncbi:MAG: hypothetical protein LWW86_16630 [Micrococcales bacterium]|nr:hypothetical protein [Micrococcales bacterium]
MNGDPRVDLLRLIAERVGWIRTGGVDGTFEAWGSRDGLDEVLLPMNADAGDYERLLEKAEKRLRSNDPTLVAGMIQQRLMTSEAQLLTTQWRKETALPSGLIMWDEGEEMYTRAREQMVAAAKASVERRRYHGNRSAYLARNFIEDTLMGLPQAGSYIIQALTPAHNAYYLSEAAEKRARKSSDRLVDPERTSGKEILDVLEKSLGAIRQCLDSYARSPRIEPFEEAVREGVSYELTKSLSELVGDGETEISFSSDAAPTREIVFTPPEAEVLQRATTALAQDTEPTIALVEGEVTLLSREAGGGDRVIRLDTSAAGLGFRRLRVHLSAEQYDIAMQAHREERPVKVHGRVEREGNLHWMYVADALTIAEPEPDLRPRSEKQSGSSQMRV